MAGTAGASSRAGPVEVNVRAGGALPEWVTGPVALVERFMGEWLASCGLPAALRGAMEYALLGGGKRLRPMLALHSCAAVSGSSSAAVAAASAVEMIHAFSLVHDDLPALDNDDMRRGRATVHRAHGEAMAILVGDGLMSMAFQVLCERYPAAVAGRLCGEVALGSTAMICGQVLDTLGGFESAVPPMRRLETIHAQKTGALIRASCRVGVIAGLADAGRDDAAAVAALSRYGDAVGLMFQIVDDLLDVQQSAEHTGKRTGKDEQAGKLTYPGLIGVERSRAEVSRLREEALASVAGFGGAARGLVELCEYLAVRTR
jgi:geranylgeranyl diphosphate synthase type II